eukprot:SAG11_NODE_8318_length_1029_cov_2.566667_1_plen_93_part_10
MQSQASDCGGGQEHAKWSGADGKGIAPKTLDSGGAAAEVRAACLRAVGCSPRGLPRLTGFSEYAEMRRDVRAASDGVEAATRRVMVKIEAEYS